MTSAAINAVEQWVFEPVIVNGKPAAITVEVPMEFKLPVSRGSIAIATNPSALLDLPDNNDDLLTYLRDLARAKGGNGDITLTVDGFKQRAFIVFSR